MNGTVEATSPASAVIGNSTSSIFAAVVGGGPAIGVYGTASGATGSAVYGTASGASGYGVYGTASGASGYGVYGSGATGVVGVSTGTGPGGSFTGFLPSSASGSGSDGVEATGGFLGPESDYMPAAGVVGVGGTSYGDGGGPGGSFTGGTGGDGDGVDGIAGKGTGDDYGGNFVGSVNTTGSYLTGGLAALRIDNPLDPANRYLVHSSVESSEMKNMYDGNVTTDGQGQATVQLPQWFEVLNTDFRYQLTVIGQFAQAIVAHEIQNNRFEIRTSAPNVKVSWQVTGVRQDAYAKANPLVVEQEKQARLRGYYVHPELYGAPPEKQIEWARHPQMMKKIKEMQARQLATLTTKTAVKPSAAQPK